MLRPLRFHFEHSWFLSDCKKKARDIFCQLLGLTTLSLVNMYVVGGQPMQDAVSVMCFTVVSRGAV